MFSGMDASLTLRISDSSTVVCSTRGMGWLGGASASKAVAKGSLVSRVKAGCLCGADAAEAGHLKGEEPKGRKATSITSGRSYLLSLVGVLVCMRMSFRFMPYPSRRW